MKIFSAAQIKACDAYTIQSEGIASHSLMERAATACVQWIMHTYPIDVPFIVLCGMGNNGGDGFAITRLLHMSGYSVKAFLLTTGDHFSPDCHLNFTRLLNIDSSLVAKIEAYSYLEDIPEDVVIVDAIFGTGLNRPISGWVGNFIQHINSLPNTKIAIDIPSGLPADTVPESQATVFQANHTLSFQFYKRSFLHPEGGKYTGKKKKAHSSQLPHCKFSRNLTYIPTSEPFFPQRHLWSCMAHWGEIWYGRGNKSSL